MGQQRRRGRPPKTLEDHVRDGSFRARNHASLLAGELLPDRLSRLRSLQARYRAACCDPMRRDVAAEFERTARRDSARILS